MKKLNLKLILSILLAFTLFSSNLVVYASPEGNGTAISGGRGGSSKIINGVSENKSGYLCYVTDSSGGLVSSVEYIAYSGGVAGAPVGVKTRLHGASANFGGQTIASATNGSWNKPPFTFSGGTYGGSLKGWMVSKNGADNYNVTVFLSNVFDMGQEEFVDNDYVLNVEAVAWSRISETSTIQVGYTAPYIAQWYNNGLANHSFLNGFWMVRFQTCGMLEQSWAGLNISSPPASNTSPFGIIQIRAKDLGKEPEEVEPPEPVAYDSDDFVRPDEVNVVVTDMMKDDYNMRDFNKYETTLTGSLSNIKTWSGWVFEKEEHNTATDDFGTTVVTGHDYIYYGTVADSSDIIEDDVFHVDDTVTDAVNGYGHYLWCEEALADDSEYEYPPGNHTFELDTTVCPGFGYNYSKRAFGEKQVVTDFRNDNNEGFAEDIFQSTGHELSTGADVSGVFDGEGLEVGKEGMISGSNSTEEKYTAWAIENYHRQQYYDSYDVEYIEDSGYDDPSDKNGDGDLEYWEETYTKFINVERVNVIGDENTFEDFQARPTFTDFVTYNATHRGYKYTCAGLKTAEAFRDGGTYYARNSSSWVCWVTQIPSKLSAIPEIKYTVWNPSGAGNVAKSNAIKVQGSRSDLYIMGEKMRSCFPAAVHGYKVTNLNDCQNHSYSLLDAPLTGTSAKDISRNNDDVQVSAQGSGFQLAIQHLPVIHTYSAQLSLNDGSNTGGLFNGAFNPLAEWGASTGKGEHLAFTDNINSSVYPEVDLKYTAISSNGREVTRGTADSNLYILGFAQQENQIRHDNVVSYWVHYKDGSIICQDGLNEALSNAFGGSVSVESIWGNQIRAMFEDKGESKTSVLNLKTYKGDAPYNPGKWYQEDCVTFVVNFYHSSIKLGDILLDDKNDYGTVEQTEQDIATDFLYQGKSAAMANFKLKLFHMEDFISGDSDNNLIISNDIKYIIGGTGWNGLDLTNAKFAVSSQTTTGGH